MKYEIKAQADGQSADIYINDFIGDWIDDYWGFGVTSKSFIKELQDLPEAVKTIRLHVNCPGGDVVSANHIANTIRDQQSHKGRIFEGLIEGAAWSAATIITSACKPTKIADNALMMVHNPWTITLGNAAELRKSAETMDKFRDSIIAAYKWKSPLSEKKLIALMDEETWMDASDAISNGFADERIAGVNAAAFVDEKFLAKLPKIPEKYQARVQAMLKPAKADPLADDEAEKAKALAALEAEKAAALAAIEAKKVADEKIRADAECRARDILAACAKAGVPNAATGFLDRGLSAEEVKAKLADADKIRARCAAAKLPQRADGYITAGMNVKEVADDLFDVLIARQGPEIDNSLRPESERTVPADKPKTATATEIYAMRNKRK